MKRLIKQATHDWNNRDMAIVYVDGEVYEDAIHGICLQRYLEEHGSNQKVFLGNRPDIEWFMSVSEMNGGQDVILAHRVDKADSVYFIYGLNNGQQLSDEQIKKDLSKVYPDYEIINDIEHDDNDNHGYDEEEQMDKGRERLIDFEQEDFKEALETFSYKRFSSYRFYNEFSVINYKDKNAFDIRTIVKVNLDGTNTNERNDFDMNYIYRYLDDIENQCSLVYDLISKYGFKLDENQLENEMVYSKEIPTGETIQLYGGYDDMILDLSGISRDSRQQFEIEGFSNEDRIPYEKLGKLGELSNKIIEFSEEDAADFSNLDFDADFDFDDDFNFELEESRLGRIKKSEFIDKKEIGKDETSLFKNPTPEEVEIAKTEGRGMVRGLIDGGDIYIWNGRVQHYSCSDNFGLNINSFRFALYPRRWVFDAGNEFSVKETIDSINNNKAFLESINSLEFPIEIYNPTDDVTQYLESGFEIGQLNQKIKFNGISEMNTFEERTKVGSMKRLIKRASLPCLNDLYPDYYLEYEFVDIGMDKVPVEKIIGPSKTRVEDYNDDWTPVDPNDERWIYQKELVESGETMQPVDLIEMPDGNYVVNSDGNHRVSVAHVLGLKYIDANISLMVKIEDDEEEKEDPELTKLKEEFDELQKQYKEKRKEFNKLYEETFFSDGPLDKEKEQKVMDMQEELSSLDIKISDKDEEIRALENELKRKSVGR